MFTADRLILHLEKSTFICCKALSLISKNVQTLSDLQGVVAGEGFFNPVPVSIRLCGFKKHQSCFNE